LIESYDFCRQYVYKELVSQLGSFLSASGLGETVTGGRLTADLEVSLTDEALIALFRSCTCPAVDPSGKLPSKVLRSLPDVLGVFVLADINYRLKRNSPTTIDETLYSKDPNEARVQMLTKWMQILGVSTPSFVTRLNASGFAIRWGELCGVMISGMLVGLSRTSDEEIISKGRRVASEIPLHRTALTEYFIDRLGTSPLEEDSPHSETTNTSDQKVASRTAIPKKASGETEFESHLSDPWVYDPKYLFLRKIIGLLPSDQNSLSYWHRNGRTNQEIAKGMGTSVKQVESVLKQAEEGVRTMTAAKNNEIVHGYVKFGTDGKPVLSWMTTPEPLTSCTYSWSLWRMS